MSRYAMAVDVDLCLGCEACLVACQTENELPEGRYRLRMQHIVEGIFPDLTGEFRVESCYHCEDAPCINVCPTGATYQTESGIVLVDPAKCTGLQGLPDRLPVRDALRPSEWIRGQVHAVRPPTRDRRASSLCDDVPNRGARLRRSRGLRVIRSTPTWAPPPRRGPRSRRPALTRGSSTSTPGSPAEPRGRTHRDQQRGRLMEIEITGTNPEAFPNWPRGGGRLPDTSFSEGSWRGLMILAAVLRRREAVYQDAVKKADLLALPLLVLGLILLWLDLGNRWNAWRFFTTFEVTSAMSWGSWILLAASGLLAPARCAGVGRSRRPLRSRAG